MIVAPNAAAASYRGIHPNLDLALGHITPEFLASVPTQKQQLAGDDVYVTRFDYTTLPPEETFYEAHERYLDIHILLSGAERVDIAPPDTLTRFESRPEADFYAYRGEAAQRLVLRPGSFLVVFPEDAHRIKMYLDAPAPVSKAVFKVRIR